MLQSALSVMGLASSIGIGLILLTAGAEKLQHRAILPGVIANYRLLPDALVTPAAMVLPAIEMLLGALLLIGISPAPIVMAAALLLLFALAMGINVARGRTHISCGCGHADLQHGLSWTSVARNVFLAALLATRLLPATPFSAIDLATAVAAGVGVYLSYVLLNTLGALVATPAFASRNR